MTILAAVGLIREARLFATPDVRPVVGGGRSDLLAQRLRAALKTGARGVISIGIGGGLDPALRVGDVVIGEAVLSPNGRRETDPDWTARLAAALPGAKLAPIWGADAMVLKASEKSDLWATGCAATDMESRTAAELAQAHGVAFTALRVISDTAGASLPSAVLAGMRPYGGMNLPGVLAALARRPNQLAALMRVGRDADMAFKSLERTLQALGPGLAF